MAPSYFQVPFSNMSYPLLYNKPPQNLSGLKQHRDTARDAVSHEFRGTVGGLSPLHVLSAVFTHVSRTLALHVAFLFPRGRPGLFLTSNFGRICPL